MKYIDADTPGTIRIGCLIASTFQKRKKYIHVYLHTNIGLIFDTIVSSQCIAILQPSYCNKPVKNLHPDMYCPK